MLNSRLTVNNDNEPASHQRPAATDQFSDHYCTVFSIGPLMLLNYVLRCTTVLYNIASLIIFWRAIMKREKNEKETEKKKLKKLSCTVRGAVQSLIKYTSTVYCSPARYSSSRA